MYVLLLAGLIGTLYTYTRWGKVTQVDYHNTHPPLKLDLVSFLMKNGVYGIIIHPDYLVREVTYRTFTRHYCGYQYSDHEWFGAFFPALLPHPPPIRNWPAARAFRPQLECGFIVRYSQAKDCLSPWTSQWDTGRLVHSASRAPTPVIRNPSKHVDVHWTNLPDETSHRVTFVSYISCGRTVGQHSSATLSVAHVQSEQRSCSVWPLGFIVRPVQPFLLVWQPSPPYTLPWTALYDFEEREGAMWGWVWTTEKNVHETYDWGRQSNLCRKRS